MNMLMQHPYFRLIRFGKPIGTLLLLWPTLWAIFIAANGKPPLYVLIVFSLGVFLTRSAGCAINDYADIEFDRHVARTKDRPLASGAVTKKEALTLFFILCAAAFSLAFFTLKPPTLYLSIPAVLLFVTYPFTKRFFAVPQAYLGIAFSFGIPMAFVEIQDHVPLLAWLLFLANFFWVIGYDTIYALVDIQDDLKIGIKTSAITFGKHVVTIISFCYIVFVIVLAYIGYSLQLSILFWLLWCYATWLLAYQIRHVRKNIRVFQMFLLNNRVGYVILLALLLDGLFYRL